MQRCDGARFGMAGAPQCDLRISAWSFSIESAPRSVQPFMNSDRENSKGTFALSFQAKMSVVMSRSPVL